MPREHNILDVKVIVSPDSIFIGAFSFSPGERDKLTELIGIAGSMASMKVLPDKIGDGTFSIRFTEDGKFKLFRKSTPDKEVCFDLGGVDAVVRGIQESIKMSLDIKTLEPQPRQSSTFRDHESADIYEGGG